MCEANTVPKAASLMARRSLREACAGPSPESTATSSDSPAEISTYRREQENLLADYSMQYLTRPVSAGRMYDYGLF